MLVESKFMCQQLPGSYKPSLFIPQGHTKINIWHHFMSFFSFISVYVQYYNDDEDDDNSNVSNSRSNLLLSVYCVPGPVLR